MNIPFPLLLDGATGTELQKLGYTGGVCAEQWILEHPEAMQQILRGYLEAGSQVLLAPTFGANRVKLEEHHLFGKVEEYNQKLVALTREIAGDRAWVAADIAPTGQFLSPLGSASFEELVEIYKEQAAALESSGVDLFLVETMMTLSDARAAVLAIRSVSKRPVFVSFTCDAHGRTLTGMDVTAALVVLQGMGVDAFGLNCSVGLADMLRQIQRLREYAEVPLLAKPNAGLPETVDGKAVYHCTPAEFVSYTAPFAQAGVDIFGGCCGTDASYVAALKQTLRHITTVPPAPRYPTLLPCSTEKLPQYLPTDVICGTPLRCSRHLDEELEAAQAQDAPVVSIAITSPEDLEFFSDCQFSIVKALCLVCDRADLLEQALRLYQGRALYEGPLDDSALVPLVKKYGLVI